MSFLDELPTVKSGCGILGILRKRDAAKIRAQEALGSIECVRFRGSKLGAGFAAYNIDGDNSHYRIKVFVDGVETLETVKQMLAEYGVVLRRELGYDDSGASKLRSWAALADAPSREALTNAVARVNEALMQGEIRGRIYSWGRYVDVCKGVGYPEDVCVDFRLVERGVEADLWIAHTRQPTNSPGIYPIWSHPFAANEWAIAHNGDVSSYGANMEYLRYRGYTSFVGTDSEVMAYLLDHLTRVKGLAIEEAAEILCNPYEAEDSGMGRIIAHRGAPLDGPFSVVAGYCDGDDIYMLALADRSKFRPLVVGEDGERIYVASEEAEIRTLSSEARVWTVKPGGYLLASLKRGIIHSGREDYELFFRSYCTHQAPTHAIDAEGMGYAELNRRIREALNNGAREVHVKNVRGQRYLGVNIPAGSRLHIYGTPGNCLANFNKGAEIYVYGNAEDDVADAMYGGRVVIHGDARDVIAQAFQDGEIFVRGNVGNRAAIQMREFQDRKPFLIVGGRADDYLGEYMAGGVVMILGLDAMEHEDKPLVGKYVATGMVGGRIYIRGRVEQWRIGLHPPKTDTLQYLRGLVMEGLVDAETYEELSREKAITYSMLEQRLQPKALSRISKLFINKYFSPPRVEYRRLGDEDLALLGGRLRRFFAEFHLGEQLLQRLLESEFTVITPQRKH